MTLKPEFKHGQGPQAAGMIAASGTMVGKQLLQGAGS
jgi:hypothetical protein